MYEVLRCCLVSSLILVVPLTTQLGDLVFSQSEGRVILEENFEHGLNQWAVEDKGENHLIELKDGKLIIRNRTETPGIFVWSRISLPKSFRLEFDFSPLGRGIQKKGFFLLFLAAKGIDGSAIFDESVWGKSQLEDFRKYTKGSIRCYHIGYLRGETGLCNLRKNPGLNLVQSNTVPILIEGETYRMAVEKREARIRMWIRGAGISSEEVLFQDWTDPGEDSPILDGGHFGFRQIAYDEGVAGAYDNVLLTELPH